MDFFEHSLCRQQLFDLICYEIRAGRVGPEIMQIFDEHLAQCPLCRRQAFDFFRMLEVVKPKNDYRPRPSVVADLPPLPMPEQSEALG